MPPDTRVPRGLSPIAPHPDPADLVTAFRGRHEWLSNFHRRPLRHRGLWFPTAEAAFQADKTLDPELRAAFAATASPHDARRMGRDVQLRPDWDRHWRHVAMAEVLASKFTDPELASLLVDTGTALLVEGNTWCSNDWGDCGCSRHRATPGLNLLGRALMAQRDLLAPPPQQRWTRVAGAGHRPRGIGPPDAQAWVRAELDRLAVKLVTHHGMRIGSSGMALGTDTWWSHSVLRAGAKLWAYLPCADQDGPWPAASRRERADLLDRADRVASLARAYPGPAVMINRNKWLVRDADLLVVVIDPRRRGGGTAQVLDYALPRVQVVRIDVARRRTTLVPKLAAPLRATSG